MQYNPKNLTGSVCRSGHMSLLLIWNFFPYLFIYCKYIQQIAQKKMKFQREIKEMNVLSMFSYVTSMWLPDLKLHLMVFVASWRDATESKSWTEIEKTYNIGEVSRGIYMVLHSVSNLIRNLESSMRSITAASR